MLKKVAVGVVALVVVTTGALYFFAQSIFSSDLVRTSVEAQLSQSLGQPVSIGGIGASILPRVTLELSDVAIGNPARITVARLDVGASTRALFSRRIENATLGVDRARIELPLPAFALGNSVPAAADTGDKAVTIASIQNIELSSVEVVSGGRTLRGDVLVVPDGDGLRIERMTLALDDVPIEVTGTISSLEGPQGNLTLQAPMLDMLALQGFAADFAAGAGLEGAAGSTTAPAPAAADLRIDLAVAAEGAVFGTLALSDLRGSATLTADRLDITDMTFGVFDGRYTGTVLLGLADVPEFRIEGQLTSVNLGTLTTWAGQPDAMTGRLAGDLEIAGRGTDATAVIASANGSAQLEATEGTVKGLELVRTIVVASSMRAGALASAATGGGSEAFSRIGGSFTIGAGLARTSDLAFESNDVSMSGTGHVGLDGTNIDLAGRVQLSEALTQQAGRDLVRYTQEGGLVTVPVSITGSAGNLSVQLETADVLRRAVTNKAVEEAGSAIRRGLGGLLGR